MVSMNESYDRYLLLAEYGVNVNNVSIDLIFQNGEKHIIEEIEKHFQQRLFWGK